MKLGKKIAATLLGILCAGCVAGGLTACSAKGPTGTPDNATTYRKALPKDGSAPTAHTGLENIGYMAYALDKQDYYHAYAYCSSKAMGYTQITQTWKDYKDKVMICSDLTYSSFVRAGTQSCFVNNEVYMRTSEQPNKSTTSTSAKWRTSKPKSYNREKYLNTYGEFSTELSVYIINEETIKSCGEVVVNDNGTYSQSFSLNKLAGSYYQYGMKTRGDLKGYPVFNGIDITFTFDNNWRVLSSYCVEKTDIAPNAMGGINTDSVSKTTTTFYYGEDDFDSEHYGFYDSYYKQYIGKVDSGETEGTEPTLIEVLGSAFGGVIEHGEQFNLDLTLGQTEYDGKIYLSIASLEDVLNNIDARIALGKDGSQDLYLDFAGGDVNAYYSDDFAMTLNVDAVSTIISQFGEWASRFKNDGGVSAASYALADGDDGELPEEQDDGPDLSSLLNMFKLEYDDSTATISCETDDLLGTGIGVRLYMYFDRPEPKTYIFNYAELESIAYDSTAIDLHVKISPDKDGTVITHNKAEAPANLADYATGIYSMLDSDALKVSLDFDGTKQEVISLLQGLSVHADAYVALGYELATRVDFNIEYSGLTAELAVYYGNNIDFKSAGKVYIDLLKVNGEEFGAKVYCDIDETVDAVKELLDIINNNVATANLSEEESGEAANSVAAMINGILNLNFGEVLGDIYASNSQIRVSADVDLIVGALGVDVNGIKFGTAALALNLDGGKSNLSLSLAALGLSMKVEGSEEQVTLPEKEDYLDAIELVKLVTVAAEEARYIIDAKAIAFDIDALVVIDDVPMQVAGSGEVSWADGLKIAADVVMTVADGTSAATRDEVALKLLYDATAEEGQPFVKFAVNNLGMEIYGKDISDTRDGIQKIIDNVNLLLNGKKSGNATLEEATQLYNTSVELDGNDLGAAVEEVVESDNVQKILAAVLGFVKDLTVSTDYNVEDGSVSKLILQHALCGNITLTADNGLALEANITNENGTVISDVKANVCVGEGSAFEEVNSALEECEIYSTAQTGDAFAKIVYNYLFAVVEDLSVSETLGNNTYEVAIRLDGNKSEIPALKDVSVDAKLYYTQGLAGDKIKGDKLAEIDLNLNIGTTTAKANVRYNNEKIYISLDQLGNTKLTDVAFFADKDDISAAVEQLVKLITDENVITTLSNLLHPTTDNTPEEEGNAAVQADEGAVTGLLTKLITFDFANSLSLKKVDGVNTATVNVDNILELFGADLGYAIGTAKIGVNPVTHAISGSVTLNGEEWATLSAEVAERRAYETGWQNGYIDIGFISTFVDDLVKTAITDGELNTLYTLGGNIDINISYSVISTSINIKNVKITAGLDENNNFYFTLTGELQKSTYMLQTVAQNWNIAVTYSNGYITMGREVGTSGEKFKVMTLDYLLTNLLHKENSPIRWLLGTGGTPWGLIADNVKLNLGSKLTTPQEYWLYQENIPEPDPEEPVEITEFILKDILVGMKVVIDGQERETSTYGDTGSILAGSGDYYGFDLNLQSLIGDTLSNVYLTILRGDSGLTGLKVNTTVAGALTVDINLDKGISTDKNDAQPDYFKEVTSNHKNINFEYEAKGQQYTSVFGCYSTEDRSYDNLNILNYLTLTVLDADENEVESVSLRSGSSIYVIPDEQWNEEHTEKLIYVDQYGNDVTTVALYEKDENENDVLAGYGFYLTYDAVIKPLYVGQSEYTFHTANGEFNRELYVGDILPEPDELQVNGNTFAGWCLEIGCENYVTSVQMNKQDYYAKYVETTVTEANGVVYTFNRDASVAAGGWYAATGFNKAQADKDYGVSENVLVIPDYVNGYPVTRIGNGAFYNKGVNFKNVVVGENITYVEAEAFRDNKDMETAVFLADVIFFGGSSYKNDGSRFVFLGCSKSDDDSVSNLKVYYHKINENEPGYTANWSGYKSESNYLSDKGKNLVDGTNLFFDGTWSYVTFESDGFTYSLEQLGLVNFICTAEDYDFTTLVSHAEETINNLMSKDGADYVNAYKVSLTGEYAIGGAVVMHVSFVPTQESERWYELTATATLEGQSEEITVLGVYEYNGKYYAEVGAVIEIRPVAGLQFTGVEVDENGYYVFEMSDGKCAVQLEYEKMAINSVTLVSGIGYTYGANQLSAGEEYIVEVTGDVTLAQATADGYTFLGWAYDYDGSGNLKFTGSTFNSETVKAQTYYAIWAVNRADVTFTNATETDDTIAKVTVNGATFYAWYTDNGFTEKVETISTSTTVLHARMQYKFTLNLAGTDSSFTVTGEFNESVTVGTYTLEFDVLEGETVSIAFEAQSGDYKPLFGSNKTYYWNNCVVTYNSETTISAYKKGNDNNGNRRTFKLTEVKRGDETEAVNVSTGENITISNISSNVTVNGQY